MTQIADYSGSQLSTIRRTVAADTNDMEFDLFMEAAKSYGLDPFRRQISAIVFSKSDAKKRKMAIIVNRDGLRAIAQRCRDYRPSSTPAEFDIDESLKSPANPQGIVRCGVTLHKRDGSGDWFPVYGEAYWDEFAPVKDQWDYDPQAGKRQPTGKQAVDGNWSKMPRLMIQKCAEAQALRAGWPDSFSGLYAEEEMDQAKEREAKDVTPSQAVEQEAANRRQNMLGNKGVLMVMDESASLQRIPMGEVADRCLEYVKDNDPETVYRWSIQNKEAFKEFWADQPNDALEVKRAVEAKTEAVGTAA